MMFVTRKRNRAREDEFATTLELIHSRMRQLWTRFDNLSEEGRIQAAGHDSDLKEALTSWVMLSAVMKIVELDTKHQMMQREIEAKVRILTHYHQRKLAS